eukprot:CAMPEP_0198208990 /NCGR_PEP_ID=MMETSP1445-20131203/12324_1 /TAXON_ID=36898 /ORGANISM="Pyramimonas sp., Strain CCMP2087" /LENGTH=329 /DNA_ID=CAMNT_0043882603 /DNA_START=198 /DNA_END=1187 /DNA_ORIENTATION=-
MGSALKDWAHKVWVEPWQELAEEVDAPAQEIFVKPWVALASEAGFVKDEKTLADRKGDGVVSSGCDADETSLADVGTALDDIFGSLGWRSKQEEEEQEEEREFYAKKKHTQARRQNSKPPSKTSPTNQHSAKGGADGDDEDDGDGDEASPSLMYDSMEVGVDEGRGRPLLSRVLASIIICLQGISGVTRKAPRAAVREDESEDRLPSFPKPIRTRRYSALIGLLFVATLVLYFIGGQLGWGINTPLQGDRMHFKQAHDGGDSASAPVSKGIETDDDDLSGVAKAAKRSAQKRHHDPKRKLDRQKANPPPSQEPPAPSSDTASSSPGGGT